MAVTEGVSWWDSRSLLGRTFVGSRRRWRGRLGGVMLRCYSRDPGGGEGGSCGGLWC